MDATKPTDPQTIEQQKPPATADGVPKYGDVALTLIHRFLASIYSEFQYRLDRHIIFAGEDIGHPIFAGQKLYYEHALAALKYAAWRATHRQPHLLIMSDEDVERIKAQWAFDSMTCEKPEPSPLSHSGTAGAEANAGHGGKPKNGQGESTATVRPKRSKRALKGRRKRSS